MSLFKKNTITFTLSVQGMKCPNCAKRVKDAIEKTRGASAEIDLAAATGCKVWMRESDYSLTGK